MPLNLRSLLVSVVLIGLFTVAMISFTTTITLVNEQENLLLENPQIAESLNEINNSLFGFRDVSEVQRESFLDSIPLVGEISIVIKEIVGVGKGFYGSSKALLDLYLEIPQAVLGIPPIVTVVVTAIFITALIYLLWSVYRAGR